jgi:predicted DNA-binding protein
MSKRRNTAKAKPFTIRFTKEVNKRLRERSMRDEIPIAFIIRDAVRLHLDQHEAKRELSAV